MVKKFQLIGGGWPVGNVQSIADYILYNWTKEDQEQIHLILQCPLGWIQDGRQVMQDNVLVLTSHNQGINLLAENQSRKTRTK